MVPQVLIGFFVMALVFVPLERALALHKQPIFRPGWTTDALYFLTGHFVGRSGSAIVAFTTLFWCRSLTLTDWQNSIPLQPGWLQFVEAVFVADVGYYIAHRLLHTVPWLWKFHAVHHSVEYMDWLATVRVHPLDQVFTKVFQLVPLYLLGFTSETLGLYLLFSAGIAFFIHANIKMPLAILTWVLATPAFHHWHHSSHPSTYNKNFAAQLPLVDLLFGTLYLPKGRMPAHYGITEMIPTGYLKQLLYPLRGRAKYDE